MSQLVPIVYKWELLWGHGGCPPLLQIQFGSQAGEEGLGGRGILVLKPFYRHNR